MVDTPDALARLVDDLLGQPRVAIDTESNSLYAYREQVCLIQISTPGGDTIVDTLALDDLSPLGAVTADPGIEKVFHAAEYDLICLRRDFAFDFAALFDTMVAARILGWKKIGLASILEKEFGIRANKRYQRANWGARPLKADMLRYAQMDTAYLLPLRDRLGAEVERAGRMEEAREAFDELLLVEGHVAQFDPHGFWYINRVSDLAPRQQAILRELYLYREQMAEKRDRPPFKVMTDQTMMRLAQREPASVADLRGITGMTDGQVQRYGRGLLDCVRRGLDAGSPPDPPPRHRRPDDAVLARYDALHTWRKNRARKRGVESDVIISKNVLWHLAREAPHTPEQLAAVERLGPWKRKTYGDEILQVLNRLDGRGA